MKKLYPVLATLALAASGAFAAAGDTWLLSDYAAVTTDSVETNAQYGYQTFQNDASSVTVKVPGGYVSMVATTVASDGTEGYTANIGLLHPLDPAWEEHDLTGLTMITFEHQNTTKITDVLAVSFGSTAYSDAIAEAGTVYESAIGGTALAASATAWKKDTVLISDMATPSWWTAPDDFPSIDTVLKHVKNLQFAPKTLYTAKGTQNGEECTKCVTPTMTSVTLNIRNVMLHGVKPNQKPWPNPGMIGCEEGSATFQLDQFVDDKRENTVGGYWFTFSDFDSTGTSTDQAKGASLVKDTVIAGLDSYSSYIQVSGELHKKVGTAYRKYSGWIDVGTNFPKGGYVDATGFTGIKFDVASLGISPKVQSLTFKVKVKGVSDTALHIVELPTADLLAAGDLGKSACIRPSDLKQASYVKGTDIVAFDPSKIEQLSWEAKITDDRTPSIDSALANFLLSTIVFYGVDDLPLKGVGVLDQARSKTFVAYSNGVLSLNGFTGATNIQVRNLNGKVVSSFAATKRTALDLPRGTYLLSATGKGVNYSKKFAVLGR